MIRSITSNFIGGASARGVRDVSGGRPRALRDGGELSQSSGGVFPHVRGMAADVIDHALGGWAGRGRVLGARAIAVSLQQHKGEQDRRLHGKVDADTADTARAEDDEDYGADE